MNQKRAVTTSLPALAAIFSLIPFSASGAIIQLTATGTINEALGASSIYNGSVPVTVPNGTAFTATFLIDTDVFPTGEAGASGATLYNLAGGGGCRSVNLPQSPLLPSMLSGTLTVGGVTLQGQAAGNQRNCDYVSMNAVTGVGDALSVQQDAYDSQIVYYADGNLTTVSSTETLYHITETRIQSLSLSGFFDNDPFSLDEVLSELAQTFTLNSFYGTSIVSEFGRGRYICSDPGGAGYRCVNEPLIDGAQYNINGSITGLAGTVVPGPPALWLLGTGIAALIARGREQRAS